MLRRWLVGLGVWLGMACVPAAAVGGDDAWPKPPREVPTFRYGEEILGALRTPYFPPAVLGRELGLRWPPVARYDAKIFGIKYTAWGPIYQQRRHAYDHEIGGFLANGELRVRLYRTPGAGGWGVEPVRVVVYLDGERVWRAEVDANTRGLRVVNPYLPRERIDVGVRYPGGEWLWGRLAMDLPERFLVGGPDFRGQGWYGLKRGRWKVRLRRSRRVGYVLDLRGEEAGGELRRGIVIARMLWSGMVTLSSQWYCAGEPGGVRVSSVGWYLERHRYLAPEGRRRLLAVWFERGVSVTGVSVNVAMVHDLPSDRVEWPEPVGVVHECRLTDGSVVREVVRFPVPNRWFFDRRYGGLGPLKHGEVRRHLKGLPRDSERD